MHHIIIYFVHFFTFFVKKKMAEIVDHIVPICSFKFLIIMFYIDKSYFAVFRF